MAAQQLGLPERMPEVVEAARSGPAEALIDTGSGYQPGQLRRHEEATLTWILTNIQEVANSPTPPHPFPQLSQTFQTFHLTFHLTLYLCNTL